ncbi:MAG TPA: hypothetical protein VGE74_12085 [Gemmata sp.]
MHAKVRWWHLLAIVAGVSAGAWARLPPAPSPPPDFTGKGFTSVHVEMRGIVDHAPAVSASSTDPAAVAELAALLRTGRSVVVCRCAALGTLEFRRPDGTSERVLLMPAHDEESIEFRVMKRGRYRVDRESFLRVVAPLSIAAARWYRSPMADSPAGEGPGER